MDEDAFAAWDAMAAVTPEPPHCNPVADHEVIHVRTDFGDRARDLMPGVSGQVMSGKPSCTKARSVPQIPHAATSSRTSLGPGEIVSTSTSSNDPPGERIWTAR
ncbi:hypothetical protein I553_6325 [Mycobacterium xenopi 4042]|uniref:Uncharacterized protein n=1 Tax=Mycobacterium xenopi 4042 TaxID=1299334 RepID=X8BHC0_MYCXE|nr:hypothetical protein I553_6325 [Mycobacterium xenopi 4042]